jgi:hypothetical protein
LMITTGCGTRHILQQPGTVVTTLRQSSCGEVMGPGPDGQPIVGSCEFPPGSEVRVPASAFKPAPVKEATK